MIAVRNATPADVPLVVAYIAKKAEFDRKLGCFEGTIAATEERIDKALFGRPVFAYALLATRVDRTLGFAFYHYQFSSFQGRPRLWLDDLFVDADARRCGTGIALMNALATLAAEHDCSDLAWTAARNNPSGIPFYEKLGATRISERALGLTFSVTPANLIGRIAEIRKAEPEADPQVPLRSE
jgi:GNAT superfamily N-acetyltransferase